MAGYIKSVNWEALEHGHGVQGADWLWVLGIITISTTVAAILLGNTLFAIVLLMSGVVIGITATREPLEISYAVTQRGLRIDDKLYPYSTLESFYIDEDHHFGPQLLVRSEKMLMPLLVLPLPEEYVDDIEDIIASRLPEEHLEEPLFHKILEFFGF